MLDAREELERMKEALALAARGRGMTHPNPMVGAVVARDGEVVGKGYHRGPYTRHAEAEALARAGEQARGADLYVTLEPCNHHGRTPPCTEAIINAGVRRVLVAARDPNPSVTGGGVERLRDAGIEVECGLLEGRARELNAAYFKYVTTGKPLIILKAAVTADGKVAARAGASRWITGEAARRAAHRLRRESDAVLVGRGTVEADDPELTVRLVRLGRAKPPLRVVVDSRLALDTSSRLAEGGEPRVLVATTAAHDAAKADLLRARGIEIMVLPEKEGKVDLDGLLRALGEMGVAQLLVEGGPTLISSFLEQGLADRLALFVAPKVFGDDDAPSWVTGRRVEDPGEGIGFVWKGLRKLGEDVLLEAELVGGG